MSSVYFQLCMSCDGCYDTLIIKGLRVSTRSYGYNPQTRVVNLDKIKFSPSNLGLLPGFSHYILNYWGKSTETQFLE